MIEEFILSHFSHQDTIRIFGFILIWAMIVDGVVARTKGETYLAIISLWFLILGALLAFNFLGYILAAFGVVVTIYSIAYTIRKKASKKTATNNAQDHQKP